MKISSETKWGIFWACIIIPVLFLGMKEMADGIEDAKKDRIAEIEAEPYMRFRLASGRIVRCKEMYSSRCGAELRYCEDGLRYICQTNVEPLP